MIVKEPDVFESINMLERAGRKAEEQMAFYLRRRFHASPDIMVINDLRFMSMDGTYAQIDHLILSRYCMVIVESKSVTSAVKYDSLGQWLRLWDNHWVGMPSPIQQIKNQEVALRELLQSHRDTLREKLIFGLKQGGFKHMPICHIAAISDIGRVIAPPGNDNIYADVVLKADLATDKINELVGKYAKDNSLLSVIPAWEMPQEDLDKTVKFLLERHEVDPKTAPPKKVAPAPKKAAPPPVKADAPQKVCTLSHCPDCRGSVAIVWGERYKNYFWHCEACGKNVAINFKCPTCGEKLRIRKQDAEYYIYCDPCNLSALYHTQK